MNAFAAMAMPLEAELLRAVLIEADVLLDYDGQKHAAAENLLLRLHYSGLLLGLVSSWNVSSHKPELLDFSGARPPLLLSRGDLFQLITSQWRIPASSCLYVCMEATASPLQGLQCLWVSKSANKTDQVASVPFIIASHNKKVLGDRVLVVGHCMKWSREKDFLTRNAMPLLSAQCRLSFVPIDLKLPLDNQLAVVDIVLNKATDEIVSVSRSSLDNGSPQIAFSDGLRELENYLKAKPRIRVVDPTVHVLPLMDRDATQALLSTLPSLQVAGGGMFRPPHSVKVTSFDQPVLKHKLQEAKVVLPCIVKPQIACGASESHTMAIVFEEHGFSGLHVPLPATVQEYVDHGSTIYKFYVIGSSIFHSKRKSTPDAAVLRSTLAAGTPVLVFDSLKSLPIGDSGRTTAEVDVEAMKNAGKLLQERLGLTIIGFDVVVHTETGDHIVVDVNYFPTFKDVPDEDAVPAFWKALQQSREQA